MIKEYNLAESLVLESLGIDFMRRQNLVLHGDNLRFSALIDIHSMDGYL